MFAPPAAPGGCAASSTPSCGCGRAAVTRSPTTASPQHLPPPSQALPSTVIFFFLKLHPLNISTGRRWNTTQTPLLQRPLDDLMVSFQKPSKSNWIFELKSFRISFQITVGKSMHSKTNISPSSKTLCTAGSTYLSHWKYHCRSHQLQVWLLCSDRIPHALILKLYILSPVFNHELAFGTSPFKTAVTCWIFKALRVCHKVLHLWKHPHQPPLQDFSRREKTYTRCF